VLSKPMDTRTVGAPKSAFPLTAGTASYQGQDRSGRADHPDVDHLTIAERARPG
jgi:hypothetical protein